MESESKCAAGCAHAAVLAHCRSCRGARAGIVGAQQPTFRAGVTLVSTDVIPRDQNGRFVADLTRENFTVLEDGAAAAHRLVHLVRGGRTYNLLLPPPAPAAAPEGLVLPPPKPRTDDTAGRVLLIFIDDLHFEPEMTPHVRKLVQTIGDTLIHEGDLVAVVSSGPSFIRDRPDLRQEDGRWKRSARSAAPD